MCFVKNNTPKKAALITGAGSGIGAATALQLSQAGYFIYLMGRDKEKLQEVALQCEHGASLLSGDIRDPAVVAKRLGELISTNIHEVEILVNNAGTFAQHNTLSGSDDLWKEQFEIHVLAPLRLVRGLIPYWQKLGRGSIVNVASTLGLRPTANTSAYSAMKAAMVNWTQSLALELGPTQIRVNCVCPGLTDTPIHAFHSLPASEKAKTLETMRSLQPLQRIGTPEEVARAICFLALPDSAWTTGAILSVDGGINLA